MSSTLRSLGAFFESSHAAAAMQKVEFYEKKPFEL